MASSTSDLGTVVLLGATGFLGVAITAHLAGQGVDVHGFSSRSLDLTDRSAFGCSMRWLAPRRR